jgi:hypothetical protein
VPIPLRESNLQDTPPVRRKQLFVLDCRRFRYTIRNKRLKLEEGFLMGSRESDRNDESSSCTLNSQTSHEAASQSAQEKMEEQRKIRRLQMMMDMVMSVISQDGSLTVDQAAELVADSKKAALAMFPDKELAYNIIYKPRLQRLMRERYRIQ